MFKVHDDENLRDIPDSPAEVRQQVMDLQARLPEITQPLERVRLLCEIGTGLRLLRR